MATPQGAVAPAPRIISLAAVRAGAPAANGGLPSYTPPPVVVTTEEPPEGVDGEGVAKPRIISLVNVHEAKPFRPRNLIAGQPLQAEEEEEDDDDEEEYDEDDEEWEYEEDDEGRL
jgi:hypothetical protein